MYKFQDYDKLVIKNNILSGLTVALALVPEAIAFSFVAGVEPVIGLYSAFIIGLVTALLGGREGMISGATGAIAVVLVNLVANHGIEYMIVAVILMGILQILAGIFKLGKLVRMIPHSVMIGFVNGLAIVIFLAQLEHFTHEGNYLSGAALATMLGLVALTIAIITLAPKFVKAVPSTLLAITGITVLVSILNINTATVGDLANIQGGLPQFHIPKVALNIDTLRIVFPYSIVMAVVGLTESLMTLNLIDEKTNSRSNTNQECIGQGLANIICGFFGGMGGCAMTGQSMLNIKSNGTKRLSGITAAVALLFFILFGSKLIALIPLAGLVGIMFMVVYGTFEWSSISKLNKMPLIDALVVVMVTVITIFTNLAISVAIGVVISALGFAWEKSKKIESTTVKNLDSGKTYVINGPLFFGSVQSFTELFDVVNDPKRIIVDFANSKVYDHSAVEAIKSLSAKYQSFGKSLEITNLSDECQTALRKAKYLDFEG